MNTRIRKILAVAGMTIVLGACVPIPGSNINITSCVGCINSEASTRVAETPADTPATAPAALPGLPGSALLPDTTGGLPRTPPPASPGPAPAPAPTAEPTPAAPGAGVGSGVAPISAPATTEPPPDPAGTLADTLRKAEGFSLTPYPDTNGVQHICYGHRITHGTCDALLEQDMVIALGAAKRVVGEPTWSGLTESRREVLVELAYMLGATGLSRFTEMLEAIRAADYARASDEIAMSLLRPPTRAARLAVAMREG